MDNFTLIADSGSTKTDWALSNGENVKFRQGLGINPFMLEDKGIIEIILSAFPEEQERRAICTIRFYGAGCRDAQIQRMERLLEECFPNASVEVASDLLAAAKAICGNRAGIACILGTGANSCRFDGAKIVDNVPPLGYILGDEGSGAALGKRLLGDVFKRRMSREIRSLFREEYSLEVGEVIEKVYRSGAPNRFLAGFTKFLKKYENYPEIDDLLHEEFSRFFVRNVEAYGHNLQVGFVGSVAFCFSRQLTECATSLGFDLFGIIRSPFERLENL